MAFHHYPLQSEETGAVIACRSDIAAQPAQQRQRQRTDQLRRQSIAEALFDPRRHHGSQAFAGLQQDVADETVADHHVGLAAIQAIALYVSAEIQPLRLLQQTRRQLDLLVALDLLGPHVEQGDPGRDAAQGLCRHRAHHRELIEMLGTAIHVGAEVEQMTMPLLGRNRRHHRRAVDTGQGLQQVPRQRHQRPGIAGADARVRPAVADQLQRHAHGSVRLATQGLGGTFV